MRLYSFEKLEVWQLARELAGEIYKMTDGFPKSEQFGLTNQMRRSVVSISSNLAEGSSRKSSKDKVRFVTISYGSLMELLSQLIIAVDLGFVSDDIYHPIRPAIEEIGNKLNALRNAYAR